MSQSPFAGIQPVELPFSGTTDASGNFTFETQIRAAFWSIVKMTALGSGNPVWLVEVGGNVAAPGLGSQTDLGPFIVGPGEKVKVIVTNASPSTTIRGSFSGVQASDLQTIAGMYVPTPNTVSLQSSAQQVLLDKITVTANNQTVTHNGIVVPPGTHSLAVVTDIPGNLASIVAQGATSQVFYINAAIPQPAFPVYSTVLSVLDTRINWAVLATFAGITGPTNTWLVAILDPLVVVAALANSPVPQIALESSSGFPIEADNTLGNLGNPLRLGVSMFNSKPAPWQAPTLKAEAVNSVSGTTVSLVAATAGQILRIFGYTLQVDLGAAGNNVLFLEDTGGGRYAQLVAPSAATTITGNHSGIPVPIGLGLRINAAIMTAGGNFRVIVGYSSSTV